MTDIVFSHAKFVSKNLGRYEYDGRRLYFDCDTTVTLKALTCDNCIYVDEDGDCTVYYFIENTEYCDATLSTYPEILL